MSLGPRAFPEAQGVTLALKANTHTHFHSYTVIHDERENCTSKIPPKFRIPDIFLFFLYSERLKRPLGLILITSSSTPL
jgi:hypothetical protein